MRNLIEGFGKTKEKEVVKVCETLIKAGARVNGTDHETIQLLIRSCGGGMLEVVKLFAENGADYNLDNDPDDNERRRGNIKYESLSPLYAAIFSRNLEIVKYLVLELKIRIELKKIEEIGKSRMNPVVFAAEIVKSKEITRFLLDAGASADWSDLEKIKTFLDDKTAVND